jgi:hypothetical protein
VAFAKMAAAHALKGERANEVLRTKLGLIISLLDGSADVRQKSSPIAEIDLFAEDIGILDQDALRLEGPSGSTEAKKRPYHPRKGLTGSVHVAERVYCLTDGRASTLMPWNVKEGDLGIVTDEYDWLMSNMMAADEWEVSHTSKIDDSA